MTKLAVYGTLRNRHPDAVEGWIYGFKLYDTGNGFPAIVKAEDGMTPIKVDLFDATERSLWMYDRVEGIENGLYTREEVLVFDSLTKHYTGDEKGGVTADIYVAGPMLMKSKDRFTEIKCGDWLEYKEAERDGWKYA